MANRAFDQFQYALEKGKVDLFAQVNFGATGFPFLIASGSKGVASMSGTSPGFYTVTLDDSYDHLLGANVTWLPVSGALENVTGLQLAFGTDVGSKRILLSTTIASGTLGASPATVAKDPTSGSTGLFQFSLGNSSAY
jgi:hypothetical protein